MADRRTYKMQLSDIADGGAGGGGVFYITLTKEKVVDSEDETSFYYVYHSDKTVQEIQSAYESGLLIIARPAEVGMYIDGYVNGDLEHDLLIPPINNLLTGWDAETFEPRFEYYSFDDSALYATQLTMHSNNDDVVGEWTATMFSYTPQT